FTLFWMSSWPIVLRQDDEWPRSDCLAQLHGPLDSAARVVVEAAQIVLLATVLLDLRKHVLVGGPTDLPMTALEADVSAAEGPLWSVLYAHRWFAEVTVRVRRSIGIGARMAEDIVVHAAPPA